MRAAVAQTMRPDEAVYRFNGLVTVGVPLLAIFIRAFLPIRFHFFSWFELPLLVTIYFAMARRNQVAGMMTGAIIGLVQDSMTQLPIGIYGMANTIVGYGASSLSAKIDTENPGSRALITFCFYLLHQFIYITVARGMARLDVQWQWHRVVLIGIVNAVVAVFLFASLDRFRQKV
jgi:rod shape-determining protein MreD